MSHFFSPSDLLPLIGTPQAPRLIDVRLAEDIGDDPFAIPGAVQVPHTQLEQIAAVAGPRTVVICQRGAKLSQGVAADLRWNEHAAQVLEGGSEAWRHLDAAPRVAMGTLPEGPLIAQLSRVDGMAAAWLMHRFAAPLRPVWDVADVQAVADRFGGVALHRSFEHEIKRLALDLPALHVMERRLRGACGDGLDLHQLWGGLYDSSVNPFQIGCAVMDAAYVWARKATGRAAA